jgi:hypothetical protein
VVAIASVGPRLGGRLEQDGDGLLGDLVHLGQGLGQVPPAGDPLLVEGGLAFGQAAGDRLAADDSAPLPVGAVQLGWVGLAAAAQLATGHEAADHAARADEAGVGQVRGQPLQPELAGLEAAGLRRCHRDARISPCLTATTLPDIRPLPRSPSAAEDR